MKNQARNTIEEDWIANIKTKRMATKVRGCGKGQAMRMVVRTAIQFNTKIQKTTSFICGCWPISKSMQWSAGSLVFLSTLSTLAHPVTEGRHFLIAEDMPHATSPAGNFRTVRHSSQTLRRSIEASEASTIPLSDLMR